MRIEARAETWIPRGAGEVFDVAIAPETIAKVWHGYGPIPATVCAEIVGGGPMREGAVRRVTSADGSVIDEEIVALSRPSRQEYRLVRGFRPPFSWIVRSGHGAWQFAPDGDGTRIAWRFTFELTTALVLPLALPLRALFRRAMTRALARLTDVVADRAAGRS